MEHQPPPLVTIGVPVYNGEKTLARALDSLLQQDYPNLELVVSDNGSTDATREICQAYAARDPRVKYFRSDTNRGASWNFNRVFELSTGKYFMWAAHDDRRAPGFVRACVERLETCPDAVLCQARTEVYIEGHEPKLYDAHLGSFERHTDLVGRYRETLKRFPATGVYGMFRSSALRRTKMFERLLGTDVAMMQELSIHGRFVEVPERLFRYVGRPAWNTIDDDARVFLGSAKRRPLLPPFVGLFLSHARRIGRSDVPFTSKVRLWSALARHEAGQLALKVLIKTAGRVCPASRKEQLGAWIYWRWMHNPNIEVTSPEFFVERVCKPRLGWWR